jgi:TetR/AcrR family transcriptional regulator, transcriptional repressor for nem operon
MAGRPKEFDPDAALNAAIDLFWCKGFEGCSMAELLDEMQINRQSLYDTYGDKRRLFLKVLAKYMERVGHEMQKALSTGKTPLARVRSFLSLLNERLSHGNQHGCLLTNTMLELGPHDSEIQDLIATRWLSLEKSLASLLKQASETGELSTNANTRQLARLILAIMQGAIVLAKAGMHESSRDAIKAAERMISD